MATNPALSACMKCGTAHVPGAAFCGSCGTPAGSPGQPQQQAYTPPMPPPMPSRFGIPAPQGPSAPIILQTDVTGALNAASAAVTATRGKITWQGPNSLTFTSAVGWGNGTFSGTIDAAPAGPGQTAVSIQLTPQYGVVIACVVCGLSMTLFNPMFGMLGLMFGAGIGIYALYNLTGPGKDKKRQDIMRALQNAAPMQAAPAPMASTASPATPSPVQATPFEQLRKLAELRDGGAISAADFESAKARILGGL